jgi:hypothetical protein
MAESDEEIGEEGVPPPEDVPLPEPWPPPGQRTPEQQAQVEMWERAVAWLEKRWSPGGETPACPYCGTREWSVGVPALLLSAAGGVPGGGPWGGMSPVFPVMCLHCGNTVLINAILAGIVPPLNRWRRRESHPSRSSRDYRAPRRLPATRPDAESGGSG